MRLSSVLSPSSLDVLHRVQVTADYQKAEQQRALQARIAHAARRTLIASTSPVLRGKV